jgi:outer membrane receptor protein involved in Fe transport
MRSFRILSQQLAPLLFWLPLAAPLLGVAAQAGRGAAVHGTVTTLSAEGAPAYLAGARVSLRCEKVAENAGTATTDETGRFSFANLVPDKCTATASAQGFRTETKNVEVLENSTAEISFQLSLAPVSESVTVSGEAPEIDVTSTSAAAPAITQKTLESAPLVIELFQDALPLLPGVLRGPDGLIEIKGTRPTQSATLVNSVSAIDPVTGQAAISLPLEAVESLKVLPSPYSAEYGRFAGAVTEVATRSGTDKWEVLFTDFVPRLRRREGSFVGLESITPRLTFAGPLEKGKLFLFQSFDYRFVRVEVPSLPALKNDQVFETFDSHTQFDWDLSDRHHLTGTLSLYPQNLSFVNLNTFNPLPVTPDFRQRGYLLSLNERAIFGERLLESSFSFKRYDVHVFPSSGLGGALELFPEQNSGNWYGQQDRNSSLYQWSQVYHFGRVQEHGAHLISVGYSYEHSSYDGDVANQPVVVLREDSTLSQRIGFTGPAGLGAHKNAFTLFVQDHWSPAPRFTLDLGLRSDHDSLSRDALNVAPRLGFVAAPTRDQKTAIRGGVGLFYDKIPLNVATFSQYPAEIVTEFDPLGLTALGAPATFVHRLADSAGVHVPYSLAWSFQVDREVGRGFMFRFGYEERRTHWDFFVDPVERTSLPLGELLLRNTGRQSYREFQGTVRWHGSERTTLYASYVR